MLTIRWATRGSRPLIARSLSSEREDYFVIGQKLHTASSWVEQVCEACDLLLSAAAEQGGRILSLAIHPWLPGQPHRSGRLEQALASSTSRPGVCPARAGGIADAWQGQQG